MSTETFKLPWFQSTSDYAKTQDILAKINGTQVSLATGLLMNVSSIQYNFLTSASVEWWIVTHHENGINTLDSVHSIFVAKQ
jgi:hypothetical protein